MSFSTLIQELEKNKIEYVKDFNLKFSNTFKIGGICKLALFPDSVDAFLKCISLFDHSESECSMWDLVP